MKPFSYEFMRRRWTEFRWGSDIYLHYFPTLIVFILVFYRDFIEYVPSLKSVFPHLIHWTIPTVCIYALLGVIIGHFVHRKKQLPTEQALYLLSNPYIYKIIPGKEKDVFVPAYKTALAILRRQATEEERHEIDKILTRIAKLEAETS